MATPCDHTFLTQHLGTEQGNRSRNTLAPEKLKLNEFTVEDWMQFAYTFATKLNYFDTSNHTTPTGDWTSFFVEKEQISSFLAEHDGAGTMTPHLTLFVCFLKLLNFTQQKFNALTKRHVDFYYGNILQLEKKQPIADSAHLIFELAKNAQEALIIEDTVALGGKDALGIQRAYKTTKEAVINNTQVAALKNVYHHRKGVTAKVNEYNSIIAAPIANSEGGIAEAFTKNEPWLPFGEPGLSTSETSFPTATLGFAIAAPILALQEGLRTVTVTATLTQNGNAIAPSNFTQHFNIFATGSEGWVGPLYGTAKTTIAKTVQFNIVLDREQDAIVPFNAAIHEGEFDTEAPMLKFQLKIDHPIHAKGYELYTQLLNTTIETITVSVDVQEITSLQLANDIGNLKADKPFFPFSTRPIQGSSFYIDYPEAFNKQWDSATIKGTWLDQPADFVEHYIAYRKKGNNANLSPNQYFKALYFKDNQIATGTNAKGLLAPTSVNNNLYVTNNNHFKAAVSAKKNSTYDKKINALSLFNTNGASFANGFTLQNSNKDLKGPIEIELNQSFLHRIYPKALALSMGSEQDTLIPNEPYTPQVENMTLGYTASEKRTFNKKAAVQHKGAITLYHLHPFGHAENIQTLVPAYCKGGALYIGLSGTIALQQVQLLLQMLEGTENPEAPSFSASEKITWSYLSNNQWIPFTSDYFLGDTTDNFLQTGIVRFVIPPEANATNTLLPNGLVWIKASNPKKFDAVCKCLRIQAQVITATFNDKGNELSHLATGLPAETITKLEQRNPLVKKITQPFASFGGSGEETDPAFYQRVSERLRHKDRAITLWDYEHLILEQFKEVHKVKCLNHTKGDNFHAPGHTTLVVIPDIVNQNAFDIFQPRLSTAKRNAIDAYINKLNSFFVNAEVINPLYEEISVSLGVKLHDGYDPNFYEKEVARAIQQYLSPWAFSETAQLNFGISFHQSNLIAYLEQQPYVDYLVDVESLHHTSAVPQGEKKVNMLPSNPKAILVSAKKHTITVVTSNCIVEPKTPPSVCLP